MINTTGWNITPKTTLRQRRRRRHDSDTALYVLPYWIKHHQFAQQTRTPLISTLIYVICLKRLETYMLSRPQEEQHPLSVTADR